MHTVAIQGDGAICRHSLRCAIVSHPPSASVHTPLRCRPHQSARLQVPLKTLDASKLENRKALEQWAPFVKDLEEFRTAGKQATCKSAASRTMERMMKAGCNIDMSARARTGFASRT